MISHPLPVPQDGLSLLEVVVLLMGIVVFFFQKLLHLIFYLNLLGKNLRFNDITPNSYPNQINTR